MSAKWIRSRQWDDEHIPRWAWPVKALLRTFSAIPLAITLLFLVVIYAILASVPIGLLVLGLTDAVYVLSLVAVVGVAAGVPVAALRLIWRSKPANRGVRFAASLLTGLAFAGAGAFLWRTYLWPNLIYDPAQHTGLRLFAGFVDQYRSTTLRRLPGMEMSELEFYSWWPLRIILTMFVLNLVTATVRRIEFTFPNIGVLMVHTGIVTIALGSMYYKGLKQEGDTLLLAGEPGPDGVLTAGRPQDGFYDNTRVVLWSKLTDRWEQRPIHAPRYNDYNLAAGGMSASGQPSVLDVVGSGNPPGADGGRTLDRPVNPVLRPGTASLIDPDISFRIVGYASYAEPLKVWAKATEPATSGQDNPIRFASLIAQRGDGSAGPPRRAPFFFVPDSPAQRLGETEVFGLEYVRGMTAQRAADLTTELPPGTRHALIVEVPGSQDRPAYRGVYAVEPGKEFEVGPTGYKISVTDIAPQPPFPIITEGYRGATSSLAIVRVTPPGAQPAATGRTPGFDRWVYHRFPEINQDMLDELNDRGMPKRRDADPAIRISYIDASKLQAYLDESVDGSVRTIVRQLGGKVRVIDSVPPGGTIKDVMPGLDIQLGERWANAEEIERPIVVPAKDRRNDEIGTHSRAMLAVEVSVGPDWKQTLWLPFTKYLGADLGTERTIDIPGGRKLSLAFGRLRYTLPGFFIQLADFEMIAYDHRGAPRDYQSLIRVVPDHRAGETPGFKAYTHITKLNAPLQAPFMWAPDRSYVANVAGTLLSRLSPNQFKFSQAGWDAQTWEATQKLTDEGKLPRPYVTFTILGVGNNPGIHIVALGAILMSVGIPWAFYIKPLIMRRRSAKVKAQLAAGTYRRPETPARIPDQTVGAS